MLTSAVVEQPAKNQAEGRAERNFEPQVASHGAEYDAQAGADSQTNSGTNTRRCVAIRSLSRHVTSYPDGVSRRAVAAPDTASQRSVTPINYRLAAASRLLRPSPSRSGILGEIGRLRAATIAASIVCHAARQETARCSRSFWFLWTPRPNRTRKWTQFVGNALELGSESAAIGPGAPLDPRQPDR